MNPNDKIRKMLRDGPVTALDISMEWKVTENTAREHLAAAVKAGVVRVVGKVPDRAIVIYDTAEKAA